ncbi:MAG: DNA-protecting protein DprA [Sphingobacteriaceae bacterium]|nr:DNA-protecting protein DprA [Sphingobacteriaceae bacterium]
MDGEDLIYQIGLTLIDGVGDINAKNLLAYCGSPREVFKQKKTSLTKVPGIGERLALSISNHKKLLKRAEEEVRFIEKYKIKPLFFTDEEYPNRLKYCSDSPIMLFYKGNANLNKSKVISVVGSRKPSEYGRQMTQNFIQELQGSDVLVVSGLAYGIDICAHRASLDNQLQTVGVLAHGLDRIYPQTHDKTAKKMISNGGLLTDFMSGTNPDAVNFPKRNRIVAGMCDALVVVESKRQGGSLITATIANSYNKDVFAFPGRAGEALAEGGNGLIKQNKAVLIENAADLFYAMQWEEKESKKKAGQIPLLLNLTDEEKRIINAFGSKKEMHMDEICYISGMTISKVAALLLQMEFNYIIKSKPGKMFEVL